MLALVLLAARKNLGGRLGQGEGALDVVEEVVRGHAKGTGIGKDLGKDELSLAVLELGYKGLRAAHGGSHVLLLQFARFALVAQAPADGFVVRSIRRRGRKSSWQNA